MLSAAIQVTGTGVNAIVAAVAGAKIRVYAWSISSSGTVNVKWQSSTGPVDLTGLRYMTVGLVWDMPMTPFRVASKDAYFETAAGDALNLNLSGTIPVGGFVDYEIVKV